MALAGEGRKAPAPQGNTALELLQIPHPLALKASGRVLVCARKGTCQSPLGILKWLQSCVALGFRRTLPWGYIGTQGLRPVGKTGTRGGASINSLHQAQAATPLPLVCRPACLSTFVGKRAGFNYPYRGARVGGKVAQPRRPPVDPSGTDVTVPGWRPSTATFRRPPFFGSALRGVAGCFCLAFSAHFLYVLTPKEGETLANFFRPFLGPNGLALYPQNPWAPKQTTPAQVSCAMARSM